MISFMKVKWISLTFSIFLIVGSFYHTEYIEKGFKKGIDFAGGIKLDIQADKLITLENLRKFFDEKKIKTNIQKADKTTKNIIKVEFGSQEEASLEKQAIKHKANLDKIKFATNSVDYIKYMLIQKFAPEELKQKNFEDSKKIIFLQTSHVGPTVGVFLKKAAVRSLLIILVLVIIYISFRFYLRFAVGAMFALLHDLFMTLGIIGVLQIPLSVPVIAALLTILGYSINDTIVIYDRIRENMSKNEGMKTDKLINISINESLSRTIITSITTLVTVISVYVLGSEGLKDMALVLIIGVIIGTYSSSFIASPIVSIWDKIFPKKVA